MKANEIIAMADAIMPNELLEEAKLRCVKNVDGRVLCEIHKLDPKKIDQAISLDDELAVSVPYSEMYMFYLLAMIAFSMGDHSLYQKMMSDYERAFCEYAKYYIRSK